MRPRARLFWEGARQCCSAATGGSWRPFGGRGGARSDWRHELLPMRWRIALSWLSGYFIFLLLPPLLFYYHGPVVAGQMGMTWAVVTALSTVSLAWVTAKATRFGVLVAQKEYRTIDSLALKSGLASVAMLVCGAAATLAGLWVIRRLGYRFAERFLPLLRTAVFLLGQVLMQVSHVQAVYLRAH